MTLPFTPATLSDGPTTRDAAYWYATVIKPVSDAVEQVLGDDYIALTTLGAWSAYSGGYALPAYRQSDKRVNIRGLVQGGGTGTANPIAVLPQSCWPAFQKVFPAYSNTGMASLALTTSGVLYVVAYGGGGSNATVALDNIEYWID